MSSPEDKSNQPTPCSCDGAKAAGDALPAHFKPTRRDFLLAFGVGLNALAGAMIGVPLLGYALSSAAKTYNLKEVSLGKVTDFKEGTTQLGNYKNPYNLPWDGAMATIPCWVRRIKGDDFQVFAINCTHLGCPVRWFAESKFFLCPCHGGVYYENGDHAAGPPPRGLYIYQSRVTNGELIIDAGLQFTLASKNTEGPNPALHE